MSGPDKTQGRQPKGNLALVGSSKASDTARPVSPLASVAKDPVQRIDELDGLRAFSVFEGASASPFPTECNWLSGRFWCTGLLRHQRLHHHPLDAARAGEIRSV